jgi:transposase-like protein
MDELDLAFAASRPEFQDELKAIEHLERVVWGGVPTCPHCGCTNRVSRVAPNPRKRIRMGLWSCGPCRRQFTVKIGTVFEHARLPLHKVLQATYLITGWNKGINAHRLHLVLGVSYKTANVLVRRIRAAARELDHDQARCWDERLRQVAKSRKAPVSADR